MTLVSDVAALIPPWFPAVSLVIALGALVMTLLNLRLFRAPPFDAPLPDRPVRVDVCVPARNEQDNLAPCVNAVLTSDLPGLRVLVYDDQSSDRTPEILASLCARDPRVSSVPTRPLPAGWVGKQWACEQLARAAMSDPNAQWLVFIDADVRLQPQAVRAALAFANGKDAALVSTFPRQITGSLSESLIVPLIHFILLAYLPFARMRNTKDPSASAGCGQFLAVRRDAYLAAGTHAAFRNSMHDGIKMPRAVRRAGFRTDLFDGTQLAECRMYRGLRATWRGFAKNAYEGLGHPVLLIFLSFLHLVGHIAPWLMLAAFLAADVVRPIPLLVCATTIIITLLHRLLLARRFRQSLVGALLHPLGIAMLTIIQWHSFLLDLTGRRGWRGRSLVPARQASAPSPTGA